MSAPLLRAVEVGIAGVDFAALQRLPLWRGGCTVVVLICRIVGVYEEALGCLRVENVVDNWNEFLLAR